MPLSITEYVNIGSSLRGSVPVPEEPAIATQAIDIGPTSTSSNAFHPETRLLRLIADQDCAIAIGDDPDATKSQRLLVAGQDQILAVSAGLKIAVISTTNGTNNMTGSISSLLPTFDSLGALLQVVADPAAAKKKIAALQVETDKLQKAKEELIGAAGLDARQQELDNREHALAVREGVVEALRLELKEKADAIKALA